MLVGKRRRGKGDCSPVAASSTVGGRVIPNTPVYTFVFEELLSLYRLQSRSVAEQLPAESHVVESRFSVSKEAQEVATSGCAKRKGNLQRNKVSRTVSTKTLQS